MGYIEGGDAHLLLDSLDGIAHFHSQLGVQVGEGFIHEKDFRVDDNGPCQGNALLLAAGELGGHPLLQMVYLHYLQDIIHLGLYLVLGYFPVLKAECHIVPDRHVGEDCIVLEYHAHVPLVGGDVVDDLAVNLNLAAFNGVKADDHAQQRGLAAARGA